MEKNEKSIVAIVAWVCLTYLFAALTNKAEPGMIEFISACFTLIFFVGMPAVLIAWYIDN